jgi:hypothetical protein
MMSDRAWLKELVSQAMSGAVRPEDLARLRAIPDEDLDWFAVQATGKALMYGADVRPSDVDRFVGILRDRMGDPGIADACIRVLVNMWSAGSRIEEELIDIARGVESDPDGVAQSSALTALGGYIRDSGKYLLFETLIVVADTSASWTVKEAALDGIEYALGKRGRDLPPIDETRSDGEVVAVLERAVRLLERNR